MLESGILLLLILVILHTHPKYIVPDGDDIEMDMMNTGFIWSPSSVILDGLRVSSVNDRGANSRQGDGTGNRTATIGIDWDWLGWIRLRERGRDGDLWGMGWHGMGHGMVSGRREGAI